MKIKFSKKKNEFYTLKNFIQYNTTETEQIHFDKSKFIETSIKFFCFVSKDLLQFLFRNLQKKGFSP